MSACDFLHITQCHSAATESLYSLLWMQKSFFISFLILSLRWDLLSWVRVDHMQNRYWWLISIFSVELLWRTLWNSSLKDITRIYTWDLIKSSVSLRLYSGTGVWPHSYFHTGPINILPYSFSTSLSTIPIEKARAVWYGKHLYIYHQTFRPASQLKRA